MTIENNIKKIADSLERIAAALEAQVGGQVPQVETQPVPQVQSIPTPPPQPVQNQMPQMPFQSAPVAPPTAPQVQVPFNDLPGFIQYVMARYKAVGPQKGAQIQTILSQKGYGNVNDVKPEHFADLYQALEAL